MTGRTAKRIGMGLTVLAALATELWYAFDGDASSEPWTYHLIQLPWWLLLPLAIGVGVWIPAHLIERKLHAERIAPARIAAGGYVSTGIITSDTAPTVPSGPAPGAPKPTFVSDVHYVPPTGESNTHTT